MFKLNPSESLHGIVFHVHSTRDEESSMNRIMKAYVAGLVFVGCVIGLPGCVAVDAYDKVAAALEEVPDMTNVTVDSEAEAVEAHKQTDLDGVVYHFTALYQGDPVKIQYLDRATGIFEGGNRLAGRAIVVFDNDRDTMSFRLPFDDE